MKNKKSNEKEKYHRIKAYGKAYLKDYGFEKEMVRARQEIVLDFLAQKKPSTVVEIGCGIDPLYIKAVAAGLPIKNWIIVEPLREFVAAAQKARRDVIPLHIIQNFFEDSAETIRAISPGPVDCVICSGILHEVPHPEKLLQTIRIILENNGSLHINVPNAYSLHRRLAKAMRLVKNVKELTSRNKKLMQYRVFDITELKSLITQHGFSIENSGGYFLKPFPNEQMNAIRKILTPKILHGLFTLGKEMPEFANEIFVNARIKHASTKGHSLNDSQISSWSQWFDRSAQYYKDPRMKMAYYENRKPMPMHVIKAIHEDVWKKLHATNHSALLDVGTGVGFFFRAFSNRLQSMIGIDASAAMLRTASRLNPKGIFLCGNATTLPFASKSFDRVLCYSVFHYLSTPQKAKRVLDELVRVTKHNGLILIGDILPQENFNPSKPTADPSGLVWWPTSLTHNLRKQTFKPKFFADYCKKNGFKCRILAQNIPGKLTAASRYDVIIRLAHA